MSGSMTFLKEELLSVALAINERLTRVGRASIFSIGCCSERSIRWARSRSHQDYSGPRRRVRQHEPRWRCCGSGRGHRSPKETSCLRHSSVGMRLHISLSAARKGRTLRDREGALADEPRVTQRDGLILPCPMATILWMPRSPTAS